MKRKQMTAPKPDGALILEDGAHPDNPEEREFYRRIEDAAKKWDKLGGPPDKDEDE